MTSDRDKDTWLALPVTPALRKMEQKMLDRLALPKGASVLDAGCGVGHVALFMARQGGLNVTAIDVVEHHVEKARRNIRRSGLPEGRVTAGRGDYHNLEWIPDETLDGVYTMETLVHATDLDKALRGFFRILRPGGRLVGHEYETRVLASEETGALAWDVDVVVSLSAMPLDLMRPGHLRKTLEGAGFVDVNVRDYSENVRPMLRLFYCLAIVPYLIVRLLRLEKYFINTVAGAGGLPGQKHWKYISISATKPGGPLEASKTK